MVKFILCGRVAGQETPVLITNLKELASLMWETFGGKDGIKPEQQISIGFGVILSMLLAHESGMALTIGTLLRYLAFTEARLTVHEVEWIGGVEFPIVIDYKDLQAEAGGPFRMVYRGQQAKDRLAEEDERKGEVKDDRDDAHRREGEGAVHQDT